MNSAFANKAKQDLAEEELQYRRGLQDSKIAAENREFEESVRQFGITERRERDESERRAGIQESQVEVQREANALRAEANALTRETELLRQQSLADASAREAAEAEKAERLNSATVALSDLQIMMNAPVGTYTTEDILRAVNDTEGTALDVKKYLGADVQGRVAGLSETIRRGLENGDLNLQDRAILDGMSTLFDNQRGALVGRTVDESFPNAPEAYKDGNWEVVDRRVINASADPQTGTLGADVTVVIRDKNTGDVAYYDAPLTANRTPDGDRASVSIEDAISGVAGVSMMVQELEKNRPMIEQALIRSNFESEQAFNGLVEAELQNLKAGKLDRPNGRDILSSKDNSMIPDTQLRAIARSRVLGLGQQSPDFYTDRQRTVTELRRLLAPSLQRASNADGTPFEFTDGQILKIGSVQDSRSVISPKATSMIRDMVGAEGIFAEGRTPRRRTNQRLSPLNP
jgi:hypothetical protein